MLKQIYKIVSGDEVVRVETVNVIPQGMWDQLIASEGTPVGDPFDDGQTVTVTVSEGKQVVQYTAYDLGNRIETRRMICRTCNTEEEAEAVANSIRIRRA